MKISVLIAAHTAAEYLPTALSCLGAQTHTEWDLVVGTYGPHDGSGPILQQFAAEHPAVTIEPLAGVDSASHAMNQLLSKATGDAVAFLHPQDAWMPRHLAIAVQQLCSGADVVVSDVRVASLNPTGLPQEIAIPKQVSSSPLKTIFSRDVIPGASCVVMRRSTLSDVGHFDERFTSGAMRDLLLRCAVAGARFSTTHRATCRNGPSLLPARAGALRDAEEAVAFYEKHRDLAGVPAALRRRLLAGSLVAEGRLLRTSDPNAAARCFLRAWSLQPVHVQTLGQFALTGWRNQSPGEKENASHP